MHDRKVTDAGFWQHDAVVRASAAAFRRPAPVIRADLVLGRDSRGDHRRRTNRHLAPLTVDRRIGFRGRGSHRILC
jgi:hypothetical protein